MMIIPVRKKDKDFSYVRGYGGKLKDIYGLHPNFTETSTVQEESKEFNLSCPAGQLKTKEI